VTRFTDGRVPSTGIGALFGRPHRWQRWLDVEAALAAAEADLGVIPAEAGIAIGAAATLDRIDVTGVEQGIAATSHPLMALVTELSEAAGEPHGGWVHWGATTQNITQTGDVLVLREAHRILLGLLARVLAAAGELARRSADMAAAGRTHGQQAVPVTFGFKVAAWIDELARHAQRLRGAEDRVFLAMMGGAVGNFASLGPIGPAVQAGVAARLGLTPMAVPSRASGDGFAEYVCTLALLAGPGGRIAAEVYELMKAGLELDEGRMRANLDLTGGLISSEAVMLALGRNLGRQTAHEIVYQAARAAGPGLSFAQALQRDPRVTKYLSAAELKALLDPATHTGLSADLARTAADRATELAAKLARAAGPG
jgi:adenylosuccinate lyase